MFDFDYLSNITITAYTICLATGALLAMCVGFYLCKKRNLLISELFYILLIAGICAGIGAKFFAIMQNLSLFQLVPLNQVVYILLRSGFSFFGGVIGYIIGIGLYAHYFKVDLRQYLRILIYIIPFFLIVARIGCYLSGCCYGIQSTSFLAFPYHNENAIPQDAIRYPVVLWDAAFNAIFIIIMIIAHKYKKNMHPLFIYLPLYATLRLIIDNFRQDLTEFLPHVISTPFDTKWVCIIIIVSTIYLVATHKTTKVINLFNQADN